MTAPTKTLRFTPDVLQVLQDMTWNDSGTLGQITTQLDRNLYTQVNKALETMGGKWNRKAGGHIFDNDPRSQVEGLLINGTLEVVRDGFFETPRTVINHMLDLAPLPPYSIAILEPSAGRGAILKVLFEQPFVKRYMIHACELNGERASYLNQTYGNQIKIVKFDFLEYELPVYAEDGVPMFHYDRIYMNPPFENGQDIEHVMHAWDLLGEGGQLISVMSEGVFFQSYHRATSFREFLAIHGTDVKLRDGSFHASGTDVKARLVRLTKEKL